MGLSAGTKLGPYEIVAPLGAGGMGEVYRARDTRLGRDVAIKVVHPRLAADPERLSRFEKEARAAAQLDHPNILVVHDVGTHEGSPFIVSELLQGEALREKLGAPLPPKRAVDYAIQIARGLAAAHEKGIVHRDIKPENVFVTKDGHVKILDFGIAKLLPSFEVSGVDTETPTESVTQPGTAVGTVAYMSPEQIRGQPVDARTDLFSFGVVLYEMLSGKRPFQRETPAETMTAIIREEPPDLSETNRGIPAALENVVRHCLEKDLEGRFQSARDVSFALETLPDLSAVRESAPMSPTGVWLHRHRKALAIAVTALAVALAGALIVSRTRSAASKSLPSVLALPCKVYGAPEVAYLTDAVPGAISTLLAGVPGIDTKVPPSSIEVERLKGDLAKIAGAFQVKTLLLTTITANGDRLVLNAQVVEADTRKVRWGKQYEGLRRDFNELARQAAEGVRQAVSAASAPVPTAPSSGEAELAFREGKYFLNNYRNRLQKADFDLALKSFTAALERDPSFARAAGEIARLYFARYFTVAEGEKDGELRRIESWARRAIDLDPRCGEAWDALSWVVAYGGDFGAQVEYSLKAVQYAPRDAGAHIALAAALGGPGSDLLSLAAARRAWEVDPLQVDAAAFVAFVLPKLGKLQEALLAIDRALALEPESSIFFPSKSRILTKLGRFAEAADLLLRSEPPPTEIDRFEIWRQSRLALALAEGDAATVRSLEDSIFKLVSGERRGVCVPCYLERASIVLAPWLAHVGRRDDALRILLRSVELGNVPTYDWLVSEPDIQLLRADPRFAKVLNTSRNGAAMVARILGQARARGELPKYLETPLDELLKLLNEEGAKG